MFPFRRVLVALAGTETDAGLLDYAAMIGKRSSGVEFLCVHIAASEQALKLALPLRERAIELLSDEGRANSTMCEFVHW